MDGAGGHLGANVPAAWTLLRHGTVRPPTLQLATASPFFSPWTCSGPSNAAADGSDAAEDNGKQWRALRAAEQWFLITYTFSSPVRGGGSHSLHSTGLPGVPAKRFLALLRATLQHFSSAKQATTAWASTKHNGSARWHHLYFRATGDSISNTRRAYNGGMRHACQMARSLPAIRLYHQYNGDLS